MSTTGKDQDAFPLVEVEFVSTAGEGLSAKSVVGVKFVGTTAKHQAANTVIPLDTLPRSYGIMLILS